MQLAPPYQFLFLTSPDFSTLPSFKNMYPTRSLKLESKEFDMGPIKKICDPLPRSKRDSGHSIRSLVQSKCMDEYENTVYGVPDLNPGHMGSTFDAVGRFHPKDDKEREGKPTLS